MSYRQLNLIKSAAYTIAIGAIPFIMLACDWS
jgi:hypothetical protein